MFSPRIENIALSGTIEINAKTIEMIENGIDVINLCPGEPDLPTPKHIKIAAQKAIDENKTKYTINNGIKELREAVCTKFLKEYGAKYQPTEVIISNGAKQAIYGAIQTIIAEDDEVILPAPYYVSYTHMIKLAGGIPVVVKTQTSNSYKITSEELKQNLTENSKALILCNPNNPSGAVYTKDELLDLAKVALENNLLIITDEVYEKLIYDDVVFTSLAELGEKYRENLIVVNGVSKAYSMTGWRIGYAVAPIEIINGMNKLQSHSTSNACSISQYAALEALVGPQDSVNDQRSIFQERRDLIHNTLTNIKELKFIEPHGAFYYFVNIKEILKSSNEITNSEEFCLKLLNEGNVATVPGSVFGMEGYFRISYSKSKEELSEAMKRIEKFISVCL